MSFEASLDDGVRDQDGPRGCQRAKATYIEKGRERP
jgi:hypothetical protein